MNNDPRKLDTRGQYRPGAPRREPPEPEGPRGEPLDLENARYLIQEAERTLEDIPWPPFFALEESAAKSLVSVAAFNLEKARSRLDLEEARRIRAGLAGDLDERPLMSVLDPHPEPPAGWDPRMREKLGLKEREPWRHGLWGVSLVLVLLGVLLAVVLRGSGVLSW